MAICPRMGVSCRQSRPPTTFSIYTITGSLAPAEPCQPRVPCPHIVLYRKGAIIHSHRSLCHTLQVFAIPKASRGRTLIFDLRILNNHIRPLTIRFTGHQRLRQFLPQGAWMACLDIQDAYLHDSMHPSARIFLCFQVNGQYFGFICLLFGLNIAPLSSARSSIN